MTLSDVLLQEFDREMANTRKALERIPEDRFDWKPHPKSMTMGGLATHLANITNWAALVIEEDSFDIAPGGTVLRRTQAASKQEVLEIFDRNLPVARAAIAGAGDENLQKPWSLLQNGTALFTQARIIVLRNMVMNHTVHHRAQLGVYLRLNDIPVPGFYGPSADEA